MKQLLLSLFFISALAMSARAQSASFTDCWNCNGSSLLASDDLQFSVYPNPATDFIMLKNSTGVQEIKIFNLIGRQVKSFNSIAIGNSYPVADLPNGMYLVQLLDVKSDVMATHRMNKR